MAELVRRFGDFPDFLSTNLDHQRLLFERIVLQDPQSDSKWKGGYQIGGGANRQSHGRNAGRLGVSFPAGWD